MNGQDRIRFSSLSADPEAYLHEMFQLHPDATHDKRSGAIEIKNPVIDSSFRYLLLEEGLFLFSFSSFSPVDAEYEFIPNPRSDYFTLVFYFTESRSKTPFYIKTEKGYYSGDQFSMFFNGNMAAEIFVKARQKAYGLRLEIHKNWLYDNIDVSLLQNGSFLKKIIDGNASGYIQTGCLAYHALVTQILSFFEQRKYALLKLQLKTEISKLLILYAEEIIQSSTKDGREGAPDRMGELRFALNYMEAKIHGIFPGSNCLASLCHMSESAFNKKFRSIFNTTPAQYFKEQKMKEALQLLQLGQNVKDVARKQGYKDTSAFGRAFKQVYGKSPAAFVKQDCSFLHTFFLFLHIYFYEFSRHYLS